MDKRKNNGGARKGAGRPPKADEDNAKKLIHYALKKLYKKDTDEDNTIDFLHDFARTTRGQQFLAEHLLGKPKQEIDMNTNIEGSIPVGAWLEPKK